MSSTNNYNGKRDPPLLPTAANKKQFIAQKREVIPDAPAFDMLSPTAAAEDISTSLSIATPPTAATSEQVFDWQCCDNTCPFPLPTEDTYVVPPLAQRLQPKPSDISDPEFDVILDELPSLLDDADQPVPPFDAPHIRHPRKPIRRPKKSTLLDMPTVLEGVARALCNFSGCEECNIQGCPQIQQLKHWKATKHESCRFHNKASVEQLEVVTEDESSERSFAWLEVGLSNAGVVGLEDVQYYMENPIAGGEDIFANMNKAQKAMEAYAHYTDQWKMGIPQKDWEAKNPQPLINKYAITFSRLIEQKKSHKGKGGRKEDSVKQPSNEEEASRKGKGRRKKEPEQASSDASGIYFILNYLFGPFFLKLFMIKMGIHEFVHGSKNKDGISIIEELMEIVIISDQRKMYDYTFKKIKDLEVVDEYPEYAKNKENKVLPSTTPEEIREKLYDVVWATRGVIDSILASSLVNIQDAFINWLQAESNSSEPVAGSRGYWAPERNPDRELIGTLAALAFLVSFHTRGIFTSSLKNSWGRERPSMACSPNMQGLSNLHLGILMHQQVDMLKLLFRYGSKPIVNVSRYLQESSPEFFEILSEAGKNEVRTDLQAILIDYYTKMLGGLQGVDSFESDIASIFARITLSFDGKKLRPLVFFYAAFIGFHLKIAAPRHSSLGLGVFQDIQIVRLNSNTHPFDIPVVFMRGAKKHKQGTATSIDEFSLQMNGLAAYVTQVAPHGFKESEYQQAIAVTHPSAIDTRLGFTFNFNLDERDPRGSSCLVPETKLFEFVKNAQQISRGLSVQQQPYRLATRRLSRYQIECIQATSSSLVDIASGGVRSDPPSMAQSERVENVILLNNHLPSVNRETMAASSLIERLNSALLKNPVLLQQVKNESGFTEFDMQHFQELPTILRRQSQSDTCPTDQPREAVVNQSIVVSESGSSGNESNDSDNSGVIGTAGGMEPGEPTPTATVEIQRNNVSEDSSDSSIGTTPDSNEYCEGRAPDWLERNLKGCDFRNIPDIDF